MVYAGRNRNVNYILQHFAVMWGLTLLGMLFGWWIPSSIVTPLSLVCLLLITMTCFFKHFRLPDLILYIIPILMGIKLLWLYVIFVEILGEDLLFTVFISTVIIFMLLAVAGLKIAMEISEIFSMIFTIVVVIIVFSIVFVFFPVENTFLLFCAAVFVLLIAVYAVYEFNSVCHQYVRDDDVIWVAINLYLAFFNLIATIIEIARSGRR